MNLHHASPQVLIVDDNVDAAEVLAMIAEAEGVSAACAHTLHEARQALVAGAPALVLLDLNLPDGSGFSLLPAIDAARIQRPIDVYVMSGMATPEMRATAAELGVKALLQKPLEPSSLISLLASARAGSQPSQ